MDYKQMLTKSQLERIIFAWKVGDIKLPTKGKDMIVDFPDTDQYTFGQIVITKTEKKSTEGRVLYGLTYKNPRL